VRAGACVPSRRLHFPSAEIIPLALLDFICAPHTAVDRTYPINARNARVCLATAVAFLQIEFERTHRKFILDLPNGT